ncbi:SDR family NAD(P)-dependent oxidoreductase [Amycolatopsis sp. NPDC059090]|uniref:SDR family NAD(P)-dependent oxidoreductase n=1 Tax=unclassified Amycolatopsis TaxID=2618356 RepID=UPI003670842D
MAEPRPGAVLITGCSSGMGRAAALRLHRGGWPVYATARKVETLAELAGLGIQTRELDLVDEQSMTAVVAEITARHGAVGVLVNNAGYGLAGTVEETPMEAVRAQFEANLIGPALLSKLVLPGMRAQGRGRIVNVSSFFGRFGTAGRGYYQAAKHGLEALSDALRHEAASHGVQVVVVQPGPAFTAFVDSSRDTLGLQRAAGHYAEFWKRFDEWHEVYRHPENPRGRARFAVTPEEVAKTIEHVLTVRRPAPRYQVGLLPRLLLLLHRTLPGRAFDTFTRAVFPTP